MIIKKEYWPYLKQQHGRIGIYKGDYQEWCRQYEISIDGIFENISPFLPSKIDNILDIGGGFSGISTKIPGQFSLTVIDGLNDQPKRSGTINNETLAKEFLELNGINDSEYIPPENAWRITKEFDLIYSFAAYPFHIRPEIYEKNIIKNSHKDTVFILEVRRGWEIPLKIIETIFEEEKYTRVVASRS